MKTNFLFLITFIFSLAVYAQESEVTMEPILSKALEKLSSIEDEHNVIVRMEFDLVHKESTKSTFRDLFTTREYIIHAFADNRKVSDIDVVISLNEDGKWVEKAKDLSSSSDAIVKFRPKINGFYRIDIKAYRFVDNFTVSHYGLIIYHE